MEFSAALMRMGRTLAEVANFAFGGGSGDIALPPPAKPCASKRY
jgi:hypothetical protein